MCVSQSTMLWICISSICWRRHSRSESRICRSPAARPLVHTLVAAKAVVERPLSASRSPTTPSARPYIGLESISVPPPAKNACSTSRRRARSTAPLPMSKVSQVPMPTTGRRCPEDGMARVSGSSACARMPAAASAATASSRRRASDRGIAAEKAPTVVAMRSRNPPAPARRTGIVRRPGW